MGTFLAWTLIANAVLHGVITYRFGLKDRANLPFAVFQVVYAAIGVWVWLEWPYAIWGALIASAIGLIGLTVTFNKPQRDKTLDRIVWVLNAIQVLLAGYLVLNPASA
jgi:hypothetical protein